MHNCPCSRALGICKNIGIRTYFSSMTVESVRFFRHFAFCSLGNRLASFFIVAKNCIFWGAPFQLIINLATLFPKKLQGFHWNLLYHCYTLTTQFVQVCTKLTWLSIVFSNLNSVTAAHHFILRHLYASMQAAQTPASKLRFVTPDKESSMNTLWQEEEFEQICSRKLLTEKAADIEKTISVKKHENKRHDFDPKCFMQIVFGIGNRMA